MGCMYNQNDQNEYIINTTHPACAVEGNSHLGLIEVEMSRTILRCHHDAATGTLMRRTYLRRLYNVSLVRHSNRPI